MGLLLLLLLVFTAACTRAARFAYMERLARLRRALDGGTWLNQLAAVHRASPWHVRLRAAPWLGWQIESNWADPWVFTIYAVLRPVSLAGILVVMYAAINRAAFDSPVFTSMYLGNAFYIYVGAVMSGMGWAVVQDREHYRTLKSIYSAPVVVPFYLMGRGIARLVTASFSVLVILALGVIVLGVGLRPASVEWPLFAAALGLGVVTLALMGLAIAGIMLLTGNESWGIGDLLAGALYLFSGAVFPARRAPFGSASCWARAANHVLARGHPACPRCQAIREPRHSGPGPTKDS